MYSFLLHPWFIYIDMASKEDETISSFWEGLETKILEQNTRNSSSLLLPGDLQQASQLLAQANHVVILTGFPCLMDESVPTETDGLCGAFALAKTLSCLHKEVKILSDACNAPILQQALFHPNTNINGSDLESNGTTKPFVGEEGFIEVLSFSPPSSFPFLQETEKTEETENSTSSDNHESGSPFTDTSYRWLKETEDGQRLDALREWVDVVVSIERAGLNKDGDYLTMRGRSMKTLVAPLEWLCVKKDIQGGGGGGDSKGEDMESRRDIQTMSFIPRFVSPSLSFVYVCVCVYNLPNIFFFVYTYMHNIWYVIALVLVMVGMNLAWVSSCTKCFIQTVRLIEFHSLTPLPVLSQQLKPLCALFVTGEAWPLQVHSSCIFVYFYSSLIMSFSLLSCLSLSCLSVCVCVYIYVSWHFESSY